MPGDSKQSQTQNLLIFFHFLVFLNSVFYALSLSLFVVLCVCVCCVCVVEGFASWEVILSGPGGGRERGRREETLVLTVTVVMIKKAGYYKELVSSVKQYIHT